MGIYISFVHHEFKDYEQDDLDQWAFDWFSRPQNTTTCKRCGAQEVYWKKNSTGWHLVNLESRAFHICPGFEGSYLEELVKTVPTWIRQNKRE